MWVKKCGAPEETCLVYTCQGHQEYQSLNQGEEERLLSLAYVCTFF